MHGVLLLHNWLSATCPFMHRSRLSALLIGVAGLLRGQRLTLTDLGRHLPGQGQPRYGIKRMDRLLGNRHLHQERVVLYEAMAAWLLSSQARPVLLVDWSEIPAGQRYGVLKAAVAYRGRAVTVYEEVHTLSGYNTPRTHQRFLKRLSQVVPATCRPIIVTDAGFRGPWFRAVEALGWDWIGRVRNSVHYSTDKAHWQPTTSLYPTATPRLRSLGRCWLSKRQPYACTLYLVKKYQRQAGRPRRRHGQGTSAQRCRQMYKDPWLLATSLAPGKGLGHKIVRLYARRMQIELTFRDDKGTRWGWQLAYSGSHSVERVNILALLGTLATFVAWLVGLAADRQGWLQRLQSAAVRKRRTLSVVFVGRYLLREPPAWLDEKTLLESVLALPELIAEHADFVGIP